MKEITVYVSDDGYRFDTKEECVEYETKQNGFVTGAKAIANALIEKFYPGTAPETFAPVAFSNRRYLHSPESRHVEDACDLLEGVITKLVIDGKLNAPMPVHQVLADITDTEAVKQVYALNTRIGSMDSRVWIHHEMAAILNGANIYSGDSGAKLAEELDNKLYAFDLQTLAAYYKAGKNRKKIETLLSNCGCDKAVTDFRNKAFEAYL